MRIAIVIFPGSHCDRDMMVAVETITGRRPALVWHKENQLDPVDLIIIPGGFSFGDHLRGGAIAARAPALEMIEDHASRGGAVLGVCNGFQILLEAGLLPGVLMKNASLTFVCRHVDIEAQSTINTPFFHEHSPQSRFCIPIAHYEGNYFAPADQLEELSDNGQIAFRYVEGGHKGPANPNGSSDNIAGILSPNGRVLGMMPQPERAMGNGHKSSDGRTFLTSIIEGIAP